LIGSSFAGTLQVPRALCFQTLLLCTVDGAVGVLDCDGEPGAIGSTDGTENDDQPAAL
jgi:hypothetical protein